MSRHVHLGQWDVTDPGSTMSAVSYTHLRAHETVLDLVCRLLLEKNNLQTRDDAEEYIFYKCNLDIHSYNAYRVSFTV